MNRNTPYLDDELSIRNEEEKEMKDEGLALEEMRRYQIWQIDLRGISKEINRLGWDNAAAQFLQVEAHLAVSFLGGSEKWKDHFLQAYVHVADIKAPIDDGLEKVFEIGNIGPESSITRRSPMHSISVGDLIIHDDGWGTESVWIVNPHGFGFLGSKEDIKTQARMRVAKALRDHDDRIAKEESEKFGPTSIIYDPTPVPGYDTGLIKSPSELGPACWPVQVAPRRSPDGNLWFLLDQQGASILGQSSTWLANVHPYREDLEGYPVRWFESAEMAESAHPDAFDLWKEEIQEIRERMAMIGHQRCFSDAQ